MPRKGYLEHEGREPDKVKFRPRCRWCGKALRPFQHLEPSTGPGKADAFGRPPLVWVWKGHYGYMGQDVFCSLRCGYHYGLRDVRKLKEAGK